MEKTFLDQMGFFDNYVPSPLALLQADRILSPLYWQDRWEDGRKELAWYIDLTDGALKRGVKLVIISQRSLENLESALRQRTEDKKETGVLLFADRNLPYQKLFRVLDQIRMAGVSRISLQAEADQ